MTGQIFRLIGTGAAASSEGLSCDCVLPAKTGLGFAEDVGMCRWGREPCCLEEGIDPPVALIGALAIA